jgi:hypothetical protein
MEVLVSPLIDNTTFVRIMMTIKAERWALKKILKGGEDVLVTHMGDSENQRLTVKSSTAVVGRAVYSNQELVMVADG